MSWNRQDPESPSSDSLGLPLPGPDWRASRFGSVLVAMRESVSGRSARPANPATVEVGKTPTGLANMKHDLEERPRKAAVLGRTTIFQEEFFPNSTGAGMAAWLPSAQD